MMQMNTEHHVRNRFAAAVWELTLKCNLACSHCGSRAGVARQNELSTDEALEVVRQLRDAGIREVAIEGGEAFLRGDWLQIARAITDAGMTCTMVTGGLGISRETVRRMLEAGIQFVGISIDGLEEVHDRLRGKQGSFRACFDTMRAFRLLGMHFGVNTQINRLSAPLLPQLYELIVAAGARSWQIQLTVPMGNAADHPEILLQPCELLDLYPMLARIMRRSEAEGVRLIPGNNIGYFGPYDSLQGTAAGCQTWMGCQAGLYSLGIEADGTVKGCPSLPTAPYAGGNIREMPLSEILNSAALTFNVSAGTEAGTDHLWGFCKTCQYADLCRGGCTHTAHTLLGRRGNNPYCHHRVLELRKHNRREFVVPKLAAIGTPFDFGLHMLVEQSIDTPWPEPDPLRFTAGAVVWPAGFNVYSDSV